jgi:hypothetical protein
LLLIGGIQHFWNLCHIKTLAERLAQHVKQTHDNFLNRVLSVIVPKFTLADVGKEFELNAEDETDAFQ